MFNFLCVKSKVTRCHRGRWTRQPSENPGRSNPCIIFLCWPAELVWTFLCKEVDVTHAAIDIRHFTCPPSIIIDDGHIVTNCKDNAKQENVKLQFEQKGTACVQGLKTITRSFSIKKLPLQL